MTAPVADRRARIRVLLARDGEVRFDALAREFGVSEMTVRRDIDQLEAEGVARRVRHGAIDVTGRSSEPRFSRRAGVETPAKAAIAAAVAELLPVSGGLILDSGTTVLEVARRMSGLRSDLTVITPSVLVATHLADSGARVVLTAGSVRPEELSVVGPEAVASFEGLHCEMAVLGVAGLDLDRGLTDYSLEEARVKAAAVRASRRVVAAVDRTKLGRVFFAAVAPVSAVDVLVTDAEPEHPVLRALRDRGTQIVTVDARGVPG